MSNWLVPPKVETPNIIEDIENYCGISREEFERNGEKEKKKLILLAERLEFVEHLSKIRDFFSEKTKKKEKNEGVISSNSSEDYIKKRTIFSLHLCGHDFSGVHMDIDSLIFYLLITCIDTIKNSDKYDVFDWLKENIDIKKLKKIAKNESIGELQSYVDDLKKKYNEDFGLTRNFTRAFTEDLSEEMKNKIVDSVIVVTVNKVKVEKTEERVKLNYEELWENWTRETLKKRLKKFADYLYNARSKFTHRSTRTFFPSIRAEEIVPILQKERKKNLLLLKEGVSLNDLLKEVIKELIKKNFSKCEQ